MCACKFKFELLKNKRTYVYLRLDDFLSDDL